MNAPLGALEIYTPYRFTWDEVLRMAQAGLFEREDGWRVELLEGELVAVSPQSVPHVRVKAWLNRLLVTALSADWTVVPDGPLLADQRSGPEPDLYVYPSRIRDRDLQPQDVTLVVEVAVSSLDMDLKRKAAIYARAGVQEYWVVDVEGRRVVTHRNPSGGGWASIREARAPEVLTPAGLPEVRVDLGALPPAD